MERSAHTGRVRPIALAGVALGAMLLAGCGLHDGTSSAGQPSQASPSATKSGAAKPVQLTLNVEQGAEKVPVDTVVKVSAARGELTKVRVTSKTGSLAGHLASDGSRWVADDLLEPSTRYTVAASGVSSDGKARTKTARFTTRSFVIGQQAVPTIVAAGEKVGVGMPVIVHFDLPVKNKALFEKHMKVRSTPTQAGAWRWISDTEAHWRPRSYWKPGTKVSVHVGVNSLPAGNGIYGRNDAQGTFTVGAAHIYKVNARTDEMKVYSNGRLLRTIPITTGMAGFTTRSGVKVIVSKEAWHQMNSETIGIGKKNPMYYNVKVQWAMRMTYSGEFLHAAPWSVASQGRANVSHGCTGMSTANAGWLYAMTRVGDVVLTTGTDRPMELANGYGDWNLSFKQFAKGSAA